jgi:internalin A
MADDSAAFDASYQSNARRLDLSRREMMSLGPEIAQHTDLEILDLSGNYITSLPSEIGQLTNLRKLYLQGNRLTNLPVEIGQLVNLEKLHLDNNRLTRLPAQIGDMSHLEELHLTGNLLNSLPGQIGQLDNLRLLVVYRNPLTQLPREIARPLRRGLSLRLADNPLQDPLFELAERGPEALAAYLESLDDAIALYEAKVLLVGEGNVGKTSLVASLLGTPFVMNRDTTHGIEIRPIKFDHPSLHTKMTLRSWDFGGQEVYRVTHQFFFSRRSLYLMVWNAREGQERNEVEGWLRRIRLRVGMDARAIVVATHGDERNPELDYPHLQRSLPGMLVGQYTVDNKTGLGIGALRAAIAAEAARLPQMGQLLNSRWVATRDEVLSHIDEQPQVSFDWFAAVGHRHGLDDAEIRTLAGLLHDLGQIIYYGDDDGLRDVVVLRPEWLTKAIGYVLEDGPTRIAQGVLDHTRLRQIWEDPSHGGVSYPSRYHPYFLRLMEKFDVSYRLSDRDDGSLVAQLVPHERPVLPWEYGTPIRNETRRLSLVCQLSEPAPGLIAWLTVRHHDASTGLHWRGGAFLRHPIPAYASEALLELRTETRLTLEVRAPSPDLFFNVLRDGVEHMIRRRWPGLRYELYVPCPGRTESGVDISCDEVFRMDGLLGLRQRGDHRHTCLRCFTNHDISGLLTGFAIPRGDLRHELAQIREEIGGIAGSIRWVIKAVAVEVDDCPRLFTVEEVDRPTMWHRVRFHERPYRLVLWCEHPGYWHEWPAATYDVKQPREWFVDVAPYASVVLRTLRWVVPVVGAVVGAAITKDQFDRVSRQLDLMKTLLEKVPDVDGDQPDAVDALAGIGRLSPAQGAALRRLRALLFEVDVSRAFGDLRRVQASSGEFLWVCPDHYGSYDPGLPTLP